MKRKNSIIPTFFVIFISLLSLTSVSALTVKSVSVSPDTSGPGKSFSIEVRIENNGNIDLNDVSVSLNLQDLPFSSNSFAVNYNELLEDKSKTASFEFDVFESAKSGDYQIPIQISYQDPDEPTKIRTISASANIKLSSEPDIDVDLGNNYLIEGQEGKINVKIINKGIADIKFLEAEIESASKLNLISSSRVYIGDLNSDDFDTAEFSVIPTSSTTGSTNSNINLVLIYKDIFNKEYTKNFNEQVKIYSKKEAISLGLIKKSMTGTYLIVAIVIVVVYIIFRKIKKRRKIKKGEQPN
jgi:hypothetical protein